MEVDESDLKIWSYFDFIIYYFESIPLFFTGCLILLVIINNRLISNFLENVDYKLVYIAAILLPLIPILLRNKIIKRIYKNNPNILYNLSHMNLVYFLELIFFVSIFYILDKLNYDNFITLLYLDIVLDVLLLLSVFNAIMANSLSEIGCMRFESLNLEKDIDKFDARQQWIKLIINKICNFLLKGKMKIDKNELIYFINIGLINNKEQSLKNIQSLTNMFITKNLDKNNYDLLCSILKKDSLSQYIQENKIDKFKKLQEQTQIIKYIFITVVLIILIIMALFTLIINSPNLSDIIKILQNLSLFK